MEERRGRRGERRALSATMQALQERRSRRCQTARLRSCFRCSQPGAHIPPHNGLVNTRLDLPPAVDRARQCTFRVGNETRDWVEGKAWVFDDTIEHEAWNGSDRRE